MLTIAGGIILAVVILVVGLFVLGFVLEYWKQVLAVVAVIVGLIVIAVTSDNHPPSTQTNNDGWGPLTVVDKSKLNSSDIPVECKADLRGKIKSDFYVLPRGMPPLPNGYELVGSETVSPDLPSGSICWYHPEQFRKLYPEYNDLADSDLRSRLYAKAKIEYAISH